MRPASLVGGWPGFPWGRSVGTSSRVMSERAGQDGSGISAADVVAEHERMLEEARAGVGPGPAKRRLGRRASAQELLHELAIVIEDVRRFQRQTAESGTGAFVTARLAASVRDWDRYTIGLGEVASLFAGWLINVAPGVTEHDRLEAASQAVTGLGDDALALELREIVEAYAGGSLTEGEFVGRLKEAEQRATDEASASMVPKWPSRLRFSPDYGADPIWRADEPGFMVRLDSLPIRPETREACREWARRWEDLAWRQMDAQDAQAGVMLEPREAELPSEEEWRAAESEGRQIYEQLRDDLGDGWNLEWGVSVPQ